MMTMRIKYRYTQIVSLPDLYRRLATGWQTEMRKRKKTTQGVGFPHNSEKGIRHTRADECCFSEKGA